VTAPSQLQELSTVWTGAGHLAKAKAAIVLVLPEPEDGRYRTMDQYDLGHATMAMMLAAADLASAAVTLPSATRRFAGGYSALRQTTSAPTCWHSAIRPIDRSSR